MIEVRNFTIEDKEIQTRSAVTADGKKQIIGYASLFNHRSKPITEKINGRSVTYYETINERAMSDTLMDDVIYVIDHDPSKLIARKSAGNLQLSVTERGLMYEATLPNTTLANDLAENVAVGNYQENSFAFRVGKDVWSRDEAGNIHRNILSIDRIIDVSTVVNGAYADTVLVTRSIDESLLQPVATPQPEVNEIEKDSIDFDFQFKIC